MKRKNRRQPYKVALHTSPYLCELPIPDMEKLINESLLDAFIPKVLHVSATPEMADANYEETLNNPFWQSKYRHLAFSQMQKRYNSVLPIVQQYQLDSSTLVSCLKIEKTAYFEPIYHFELENTPDHERNSVEDFDASGMFFGISTEKDNPVIGTWTDMRWNEIGVVPKEQFQRFIQILLSRLEPIVLKLWKSASQEGHVASLGSDQEIVKGTYFDVIQAKIKKINTPDISGG